MRHLARSVSALLLLAALLCGQTSTSSINGTVSDPSGGIVPGANVTIINEATGVKYELKTTDAGLFVFPALPVGDYTVVVEAAGFKKYERIGNRVVVNTPLTIDIDLVVGQAAETVKVEASAEALQTSNATLGNVVERRAIANLPLNGRNPLTLILLEPGVTSRSSNGGSTGVNVNGARSNAVNITIDGIDANESSVQNATNNIYRLNPDNVQEFKVTTNNPTAEEGRNSGANVSVATRSGTNEFHGTGFGYFRNTALNANEFFANAQGLAKPDIKLNQYGFELSGPIKKNRTFLFGSWQGQKINVTQPIDKVFGESVDLYTASARQGVFRYFVADPARPLVISGQTITRNSPLLVDPQSGALRPEVRTCGSPTDIGCVQTYNIVANDPKRIGLDKVTSGIINGYPLPNNFTGGDGLNTGIYVWNSPYQIRGAHWMLRGDHIFNANHSMFARYLQADQQTLGGDPNNSRPRVLPGFPPRGEVYRPAKNLAVGFRSVLSPTMVNELTLGFSRFYFLFTQGEANPAFPNIPSFTFNNVDVDYTNNPRTARAVTTPQLIENFSWIRGAHSMKFGGQMRFYQHNDQRGQPGGETVTPSLSLSSSLRPADASYNLPRVATATVPGINSVDNTFLLGAINDLLGIPARLNQTFLGNLNSNTFLPFKTGDSVTLWAEGHRLKQYNLFAQDEWKVRRNMVLSYGLRWEINPPPTEAGGRVYIPNKPIDGSQGPVTFVKADRWYSRMNWGAIAPRLAMTWSPDQKTVIRTGYSIAFDPIASFQVTAVAGAVPGLTARCSSTPGAAAAPGCASTPDLRLAQGYPSELAPPTVKPSDFVTPAIQNLANAPATTAFHPDLKVPTVHMWNLAVQRELPQGFVVQAAYVGRRGTRLFRSYDINQVDAAPILDSFLIMQQNRSRGCNNDGTGCPSGVTGTAVPLIARGITNAAFVNSAASNTDVQQNAAGNFAGRLEQSTLNIRLRPNPQFGAITYIDNGGDSYYHALQMTARKRFDTAGLLLNAGYTFGKSIDTQSLDPVGSTSGGGLSATSVRSGTGGRTPQDARNSRNERARSDFDRRQVLNLALIYELPFGSGKALFGGAKGIVNNIIGGWSMNVINTNMTGEPFTVLSGVRTANYSRISNAAIIGNGLPETKLQEIPGVVGPVVFPDSSRFAFPAAGQLGAGRNIFTASSYWNTDLGISKGFNITEKVRAVFRTEMFNAFNHANFDNPRDATVGSPSITSRLFGQTCCATTPTASSTSVIQNGESWRVVQFALKLQF